MPLPVPPAMLWHSVNPSRLSQYSASRSEAHQGEGVKRHMFVENTVCSSRRTYSAIVQAADFVRTQSTAPPVTTSTKA